MGFVKHCGCWMRAPNGNSSRGERRRGMHIILGNCGNAFSLCAIPCCDTHSHVRRNIRYSKNNTHNMGDGDDGSFKNNTGSR